MTTSFASMKFPEWTILHFSFVIEIPKIPKKATKLQKLIWKLKHLKWKDCRQKRRAMIREIGY